MKIIPNRTMRLGGRRVEAGKPVEVPEADATLALRHGWAVEAPAKRANAQKADAAAQVPTGDDAATGSDTALDAATGPASE